jgi:amino acid transporter
MNFVQKRPIVSVIVVIAIVAAIWLGLQAIAQEEPAESLQHLKVAIGWGGALLIGLLGLTVIYRMFTGTIDLSQLVSEPSGDASMSRFQLLVFTFVVAISFLLITVAKDQIADIPNTVLALLGISAGSYVVSKGIQKDITLAQMQASVNVSPGVLNASPGQSVTFTASATGPGDLTYLWQRINAGQTSPVDLPGETNSSLTFSAALQDDGARFQCIVSSASGETTSSPSTLHVQAAEAARG